MDSMTTGLLVVAGVAVLAWVLRGASRGDGIERGLLSGSAPEPGAEAAPERDEPPAGEADAGRTDEVAVVASDGWLFVPSPGGVRLWAPAEPGAGADPHPAGILSGGDLIAARVAPGPPGEAPWRVEALGRDREFSAWDFESEEAARVACELLERLVVRAPVGPDGESEPVSDEEIAAARRVVEETLAELEKGLGRDEPEEPR